MLDHIREISFLRMMPLFLLGIILAVFGQSPLLSKIIFISFAIVYLAFTAYQLFLKKQYPLRWLNGFFILLNAFFLGYIITWFNTDSNYNSHYSHYYPKEEKVLLHLRIDEAPVQKKRSKKFIGKLIALNKNAVQGNMLFYVEDSLGQYLSYGDELVLQVKPAKLQAPLNPAQFNYARFMGFRQIQHQVYFTEKQLLLHESKTRYFSVFHWSYFLRNKLSQTLSTHIQDDKAFEVAASLLLGYREKLDNETIRAYSASGAMHVLAVSGLHVGIFYWILNHLLFFLNTGRRKKQLKIVLLILIIWAYAFLTGLSPSIQRAALMFSLIGIAQNINRSSGIYNSIVASAFILLCINPYLLMEVGFQLSYSALLGIIAIQPILYKQIYIENKVLDWIWAISCVSIAAQLATFPIGLLYFHQFPVYFMVSNLVVIPAAMLLLPMGLGFFAIAALESIWSVLEPVLLIFGKILQALFQLLNYLVFNIESLPGSLLIGFSPTIFETWLCYVVVLSLLFFYHFRKKLSLYTLSSAIILLLFFFNIKNWKNLSKQSVTFYAVKGATAIDLNHFDRNYFLADSALINDKDQMLFSVIHNWWLKGYTENDTVLYLESKTGFQSNSMLYRAPLLQIDNALVMIIDKQSNIEEYLPLFEQNAVDMLLVRKNPYKLIDHLGLLSENTRLIIDGSNSYGFLRKLKEAAKDQELDMHFLMEQGAYV
ncbi:MAG: ComEC/Rec2 family competence protein, partial [Chitinophagales bacterium]